MRGKIGRLRGDRVGGMGGRGHLVRDGHLIVIGAEGRRWGRRGGGHG